MSLWATKSIATLRAEANEAGEHQLKRALTPLNLITLGIGAIIGAGIFVLTGQAAALHAGPAVPISMALVGIACAFAGLCYAEMASAVPVAGSAYTYSYATMGEFVAWIIGWDLVLEYGIGAATVGIAWSEYLNKLLEVLRDAAGTTIAHGIMNVPALFIILVLSLLLIRGMRESAFVNGLIVITKVAIVILIIVLGWGFINPANHTPYIPEARDLVDAQGVTHIYGGFWGIVG